MELTHPEFEPDAGLERAEMEARQREIASRATFADDITFDPGTIRDPDGPVVAGVDQAFLEDRAVSAVVVMCGDEVLETVHAVSPLEIPYIPGLLAFREGSPILAALEELTVEPDVFLFDGSGRIHYREAGLATHIGVMLDVPAVGVAKSLLCGTPTGETATLPTGATVPIESSDRMSTEPATVVGYAVQTRQYEAADRWINPLYVSPGHRVSAETAAELVLATASRYKLPEPIRLADQHADTVTDRHSA